MSFYKPLIIEPSTDGKSALTVFERMWSEFIDFVGLTIATCAWIFANKNRDLALRNLAAVYQDSLSSREIEKIAFASFRHQVNILFENLLAGLGLVSIRCEGMEQFARMLKSSERPSAGIVLATAHLGSWEFAGWACGASFPLKTYALAKSSGSKMLDLVLMWLRSNFKIQILWNHESGLLRRILNTVSGGNILIFVMDQKPPSRKGHEVPFMGMPTTFVSGPATTAQKTNASLYFFYCWRRSPFTYVLEYFECENNLKSDEETTCELANFCERSIRAHPEQWVWNYRRWPAPVLKSRLKAIEG